MAEVATGYFQKFLENINGFWEERENIYIYGAGKYAKNMYQFLNRHDKMIKGFLVTGRTEGNYFGFRGAGYPADFLRLAETGY